MKRPLVARPSIWLLLFGLVALRAAAADLEERTTRAYDRYAEEITRRFLERARGRAASLSSDALPGSGPLSGSGPLLGSGRVPRDGEAVIRPGGEDGIIALPGGLLHHWMGASFIGGATLEEALGVSYAYDRYHEVYKPVIASKLLGRDGDTYRVLLRIRESAAGLSAVLDVTARVQYFFPNSRSAYSLSTSDEILEVEDAGSPEERHLPAGRDSGYLWRAVTLNRIVEVDGGVVIEMETLGLSRGFPPLLHWLIEPIARRLGRKSVELSLQEFHGAVKAAGRH